MQIRVATEQDLPGWVAARQALWPHHDLGELQRDAQRMLQSLEEVCFLLIDDGGTIAGFLEGQIYQPASGPYAHVEGWYVAPEFRHQGHGRALMSTFEQWCLHRTIARITSDTTPDYPLSPAAHSHAGFRKIHEFTIFLKELDE